MCWVRARVEKDATNLCAHKIVTFNEWVVMYVRLHTLEQCRNFRTVLYPDEIERFFMAVT